MDSSESDVAELLSEVVAGYEQLARWEEEIPGVGHRQWNRFLGRLSPLVDRLLASPAGFAALQEVASSHPDGSVRTRALGDAAPAPPSGVEDARAWLRHPRQALGRLDHMIEPCLYYAPMPAEQSAGWVDAFPELQVGRGSWVRGRPVDVGSWPLRDDGIPLEFVGHFDLWMLSAGEDPNPLLPETDGAIEVFHDLESYGIDGGARNRGCWRVRFVPPVTRYLAEPEDLAVQPPRWLHEWRAISLPSPTDLPDLSSEELDRLEQATADVLDEALSTAGDRRRRPVGELRFVPQLLGQPRAGWGHIGSEALEPFLPCAPDDGWVLLLDVPAAGPLDGWFSGDGHLEVWMRRSDLVRGAYEHAWVTIRHRHRVRREGQEQADHGAVGVAAKVRDAEPVRRRAPAALHGADPVGVHLAPANRVALPSIDGNAMTRSKQEPDIAPINAPWPMVEQWLAQWPFDTAFLRDDIAGSPVFTARSFSPGRSELDELWTTGGEVSWLGGPAVLPLPEWPLRRDGIPLAHVATVALADVAGAAEAAEKEAFPDHREGLPTSGVLEVFHDLETYGHQAADGSTGAWMVRWVAEPDRSGFAEVPSDVDTPTEVAQPGLFLRGWTLRSPSEFIGTRHFEAAEAVGEAYQRAWLLQHTGSADGWPVPVTHVYGHSHAGSAEALRVLAEALPLDAGDSHRLILDIESWTHLDQWFGDAAPLEVWIRESDLAARRFDRAWCMIRTG